MPLNVQELSDDLDSIRKTYQEAGKKAIQTSLEVFFEDHPSVKKIAWTQYTPYFNDGDACVFSMGELFFLNADYNIGDTGSGYDYKNGFIENHEIGSFYDFEEINEANNPANTPELTNDMKAIERLFNRYSDILQELFGDHVEVHATQEGVRTEEYDHE